MKKLLLIVLMIPLFAIGGSSEKLADAARFFSNVGIGTTAPDGALDVSGGNVYLHAPSSEPADANFSNSQWSLWLDETANAFKLKAKDSSGSLLDVKVGEGGGVHQNILAESNPGIEDGVIAPFSATTTAPTVETTAANVAFGDNSLAWDSAGTDTLSSATVAVPPGLYSQQCEARFWVKGGDSNLTFEVTDGTNVLASRAMGAESTYAVESLLFVCPSSGNVNIEIESAADAAVAYFDEFYIGEPLTDTSSELATEWVDYGAADLVAGGGNPTKGTVTHDKFYARRVGDSLEILYQYEQSAAGSSGSGTYFIEFPGDLGNLRADSNKYTPTGSVPFRMACGAAQGEGPTNGRMSGTTYIWDDGTGPIQMNMNLGNHSVTPNEWGSGRLPLGATGTTRVTARCTVPIQGWGSTVNSIPPELQGWFIDVNIGGANDALGTSAVSSYTNIDNTGWTLTRNGDSAFAEITCASGTEPEGNDCNTSAVAESAGVAFTPPIPGTYEACARVNLQQDTGTGGTVSTIFQLVETPTNAVTISANGQDRAVLGTLTATSINEHSTEVCGNFEFENTNKRAIRLFYEQAVGGTVDSVTLLADENVNNGQRDLRFTVRPVAPWQNAPKLISSVNTPDSTRSFIYVSARINNTGTPAEEIDYGDFIDSITDNGAGNMTVNFTSGKFSETPICGCTAQGNDNFCRIGTQATTSSINILTENSSSGDIDVDVNLWCHGPN